MLTKRSHKIKILLLISGSIAAVRMPLLVSKLIKENYDVKCVLTKNAEKLIKPLSLSVLSRNRCILDEEQWNDYQSNPLHINLCEWADVVIMAPLTATTLSKWVYGNAEGLVSSVLIANKKPIIVAPAMNTDMWFDRAVQLNYKKLKEYSNVLTIYPNEGLLACDQIGIGKIPSNDLIHLALEFILSKHQKFKFNDLADKNFLITGGSTSERIDPARRITNNSSGSMGLLFAQAARFRGANVTYIHGPLKLNPDLKDGIKSIEIQTGSDLNKVIKNKIVDCDYFIMNAAVTDIKLSNKLTKKIPKNELSQYFSDNLELVPDILNDLRSLKKTHQLFLGFCAFTGEFENLKTIVKHKLNIKGCDLIFANPIDIEGQGFGYASKNEGWLFDKNGMKVYLEKTSKIDLANNLINKIISIKK
ncbi:MAG: bifunctional phosphopantothenoylcysteine decarboxylase/phosphopantothenate--cysteine ligase CoaBC [Prochlorococcus sp. SP3034]|nr:bifunctional phosphopantothenoylcysteine decarboxylase/phosphopantothenate--cysteine ligase CoaBC [Prochlorococcus sp. SP3034]